MPSLRPVRVCVFDDVLHARGEALDTPGLVVELYPDADDADAICLVDPRPLWVCMDHAMGGGHATGTEAVRRLRAAGYRGHILAISSDPRSNAEMLRAGADESLAKKDLLPAFLGRVAERASRRGPEPEPEPKEEEAS